MLLVQIDGFLEVARLGSVSRAAEVLSITQPTLTARLHGLESELGTSLFVRTRQGMRLTDSGRAFLAHAERAARAVADGRRAISDVGRGSAGQLIIAAAPAVSTYLLPGLLERFVLDHPRVEVAVRTGHSEDVLQMVLRDEVQIGLGRALRHPDIELLPFYEEELVLVAAPDHPFARSHDTQMADLASEQLIMFDRTSSYFEVTQAALLASGVTLRGVMELDNIEAAKKMVEHDLGVALLPRSAVAAEVEAGVLALVALGGAPPMRRNLVAMRRRDAGPAQGVADAFISLLLGLQL
ncbi:MAG TPA: LysR family transcriptional regulator [Candidatus Nitrosotalea sp.]|nr:LysR family transcriptional regulator [Candidatus Nitrosotalea sp.]